MPGMRELPGIVTSLPPSPCQSAQALEYQSAQALTYQSEYPLVFQLVYLSVWV